MNSKGTLFIVLIYFTITPLTDGISIRRKIARYQRFRSSGARDAHGYVLLEESGPNKIINTTRSILPSLQNNVEKWNSDAEGLFEAINPLSLTLLNGLKAKIIQKETKYSELFYAWYPEATRPVGDENITQAQ